MRKMKQKGLKSKYFKLTNLQFTQSEAEECLEDLQRLVKAFKKVMKKERDKKQRN